jgi:hypothetical protein
MIDRYDPRIADSWRKQLAKTKDELYAEITRLWDALVKTQTERDTLREQLRIAREGLEAYDVPGGPGEYARDTLARMDTHTKENA